jgi:hypothetical protein
LVELGLTKEASQLFQDWYLELGREQSQATKRLDTYALRFMILLAVNDGKAEIDVDIVKRSIRLMNYELHIRNEVDPINADNRIAALEEKIRRVLRNGPLTLSELKRKTNYSRVGIWCFETAKKNLRDAGEIRFEQKLGRFQLQNREH